jgi:hypothetical protein
MSQTQFPRRVFATGASCGIALALCVSTSAAAESKRAVCTTAYGEYKNAAEKERAGLLREARDLYATCAEATICGGLVPKCRARYEKLAVEMPTVVPVATDESGTLLVDVDVKIDGRPLTSHCDGKGVPVEPGVHEFAFSTSRGLSGSQRIMVIEGQRNREINVQLSGSRLGATAPADAKSHVEAKPQSDAKAHAEPKPAPESPAADASAEDKPSHDDSAPKAIRLPEAPPGERHWTMPKSLVPYAVGGVGLVAAAGGGLLTFWGNQDNTALRNSCGKTQQCDPASVDHIRKLYLAADISFGVGAAAIAFTSYLFATSRSTEAAVKPEAHEALVVGVQPIRSGGFASVSGAF